MLAAILCVVSVVVSAGILTEAVFMFRKADADRKLADHHFLKAEQMVLEAERMRRDAARDHDEAEVERRVAKAAEAEARRIEDSLVHPRFVVNAQGQFRTLAAREDRGEDERHCQEPNRFCKDCFGKGWTGRNHDTGAAVLCKCVKVAG